MYISNPKNNSANYFIAIKGCTEEDIDVDVDGISVQVPITYLGANKNEIDIQVSRHIP